MDAENVTLNLLVKLVSTERKRQPLALLTTLLQLVDPDND